MNKVTQIIIEESLWRRLKAHAAQQDRTLMAVLSSAIQNYLNEHKPRQPRFRKEA